MWLWLKVVVTAPVPQILQLGGGVHDRIQQQPQLLQQLEKVDLSLATAILLQLHCLMYSNYISFFCLHGKHYKNFFPQLSPMWNPGGVLNPVCAWHVLQRAS